VEHNPSLAKDVIDQTLLATARQDAAIANRRVVELQIAIARLASEMRALRDEAERLKANR
jgi:hypothetical protein